MTKRIPLTQGKFALVDDDDFERINKIKWCASKDHNRDSWYAVHTVNYWSGILRTTKNIKMHRFVIDAPDHMLVDHINGDGLDNRKSNLRLCTNKQNQHNQHVIRGTVSYKGVIKMPRTKGYKSKPYRSQIVVNGKNIYLGYYSDAESAARAYDKAAIELFGEFAKTNFTY